MYNILLAFYKVHYNFAAISALFLMWAIFLLLRKNYRWFLIVFVTLAVYNVAMARKIERDPTWIDGIVSQVQAFDFVNYIWGGSAVSKANDNAVKNDKQ